MILDETTVRTLEILTSTDGKPNPSLLGLLARVKSAAGGRLMAAWLARPSAELSEIKRRATIFRMLAKHGAYRELIGAELGKIADLERVLTNLNNNPQVRHLGQVRETLRQFKNCKKLLPTTACSLSSMPAGKILADFPLELNALLEEAILTENLPPLLSTPVSEARLHADARQVLELSQNAVGHLTRYEEEQRKAHGIATLRVKHNNVLGYFIEISKGQAAKAPDGYQRRQTLTNGERYTTQELKELENKILSAEEEVLRLQKGIFGEHPRANSRRRRQN